MNHTASPPDLLDALLADGAWMRRLARSLAGDDGEDVVQETLASALRHRPSRDRPLRPWLAEVIRNLVRDRRRHEGRLRRRHARSASPEARVADLQRVTTPEEMLQQIELQRTLGELLSGLDDPFRETLFLRYYEGLSAAEIARLRGIPAGTVRWRLKVGLERLRARLDERHEGGREAWLRLLLPLAPASGAAPTRADGGAALEGDHPAPRRARTRRAPALPWSLVVAVVGVGTAAGVATWLRPRGEAEPVHAAGAGASPARAERGNGAPGPKPTFAALAAAPGGDLGACAEALRKRRTQLARLEDGFDLDTSDARFEAAPRNEAAERTLAPLVAEAVSAGAPANATHALACRADVCRLTVEAGSAARLAIERHPALDGRLKGRSFTALRAVQAQPPARRRIRSVTDVYLRLHDEAASRRPAASPPAPPLTLAACERQRQEIEARFAALDRRLDEFRAPAARFRRGEPTPALTAELSAELRRILGAGPAPAVECRGRACRIVPGAGPLDESALRRRLAADPLLAPRLGPVACCAEGLYVVVRAEGEPSGPPRLHAYDDGTGPRTARRATTEERDPGPEMSGAARADWLARRAVEALAWGDLEAARALAEEAIKLAGTAPARAGSAVHHGHLVLGFLTLRTEGDVAAARRHLLEAGRSAGGPALRSFGPNMRLARALLARGERDVVLEYLALCSAFWTFGRERGTLARWTTDVREGRTPEFGANLLYGGWHLDEP